MRPPCNARRAPALSGAAASAPKITKKPSVTKPMCAIDEYAISFFMSRCTSATKPMYTTAISDSAIMRHASLWLASGVMGKLKRMKP